MVALLAVGAPPARAADTLVPVGSVWSYLDNGSDQGTAWRTLDFDHSSWKSGPAQLGYGDGDEATVVGFGPSSGNKFIATYFRRSFDVADPTVYDTMNLRVLRDDGAVVYLNGTEVFRTNMPSGTIGYRTLASSSASESTFYATVLAASLLRTGTNVLAVEVHQNGSSSSDLGFDLELVANRTASAPPPSPPPPPPPPAATGTLSLVARSTAWKYLDDGSNQGTGWRALGFDDSAWPSGNAELGFGDGDESTVIKYGSSSRNKYVTTYFRRAFDVADPTAISGLTLRIKRDDGAVVYLNGTEVFRTNMPSGTIGYQTFASSNGSSTYQTATPAASLLRAGQNVLAVEVHLRNRRTGDMSFNLELIASTATPTADPATLIPPGAPWKYLDNGSNQDTPWRFQGFDDSAWASGPSELGYGDGDESTLVGWGPDSSDRYVTTYFRYSFDVADASAVEGLLVRLKRDDGAVVYLNGTEVWRTNMPSGTIDYQTLASGSANETTIYEQAVDPALLDDGSNVLAVEVHQNNSSSSDLSFDLTLLATGPNSVPPPPPPPTSSTVTRGPYLQMGTPTSILVRWRTNSAAESVVRYGTAADSLSLTSSVTGTRTEHQIQLTGLSPDTQYWYSVGTAADADCTFRTPPTAGTARSTRIWVIGDAGTATSEQRAVRDAYLSFSATRPADVFLMLGDNAYDSGTDSEYQAGVFNIYPSILKKSPVWPTIGNHETSSAYFSIFTLPTAAEAGGLSSGTENYYSFDHGNIHFVCLDSQYSDRSSSGAMLNWLRNDLGATSQEWVIAYWHHPPYTRGSHDSDSESQLVQMRANALPILEENGVDLVLSGHSHSYERSFLLDGHYGSSSTLTAAMKLDAGSGREGDTGAYAKSATVTPSHEGAVYAVCGSSGKTAGGSLNHPAMFVSLNRLGSMVVDIDGKRMDVKFLRENGAVDDFFTMLKE
jgi:hypothetical protein